MFSIIWIGIVFLLGMCASLLRLPPMIGYLGGGFLLNYLEINNIPGINELSNLGISLLLFSIGLKLDIKSLGKKEVIVPSISHSLISFCIFILFGFLFFDVSQIKSNLILSFALTFSSTIFVFQILENRGDFSTSYGKKSLGILVIQDIIAVLFMAFSAKKIPSAWLILLISSLIPLRLILFYTLSKIKQKELLILFGLTVSLGGAYLFDLVNVKADLGALILGVLLSKHNRSGELNQSLISLKDFLLIGFFLSIGMMGLPSFENLVIAFSFSLLIPLRFLSYFYIFSKINLKNRDGLFSSLSLSNFSEFGLIVLSFAVSKNMIGSEWLTTMSLILAFSFIFSAILNNNSDYILKFFENKLNLDLSIAKQNTDKNIKINHNNMIIVGMGRIGVGTYKSINSKKEWNPLGIEIDENNYESLKKDNFNVSLGDATIPETWEELKLDKIKKIVLAMPVLHQNIKTSQIIRELGFKGLIFSVSSEFIDEEELIESGVDKVFNLYAEAGTGLAQKIC